MAGSVPSLRRGGESGPVRMFQDACRSLKTTMIPIVVVFKPVSGSPSMAIGAGVLLNEDGWILTQEQSGKSADEPD